MGHAADESDGVLAEPVSGAPPTDHVAALVDALREREALLSSAIRVAQLGTWDYDVRLDRLTWSPETHAMFGVDEATLDGRIEVFHRLVVDADRAGLLAAHRRALRDGILEAEYRIRRPDGAVRWMLERGTVDVDEVTGNAVRRYGVVLDVTESKLADDRFRLVAQATNDAVWDWDVAAGKVWWGGGLAAFGYDPAEMEDDPEFLQRRVHPADRADVLASIAAALAGTSSSWTREYRILRGDGEVAVVQSRASILRDAAGRAVRMIGGVVDVTARRRDEGRLRAQATLLDQAADAILVRDLEDHILYWNPAAARLFGWTAEEALGRSEAELLRTDGPDFAAAMRALREHGAWKGELRLQHRSGRPLTVEARWTLVRDEAGEPRSVLAIDSDVTRRRELAAQEARALRLRTLGALASGIAHDLNNALSPIVMIASLLRGAPARGRLDADLATIEGAATRAADMVRQLLAFARGLPARRADVDLAAIVADVERTGKASYLRHVDVRILTRVAPAIVVGDATQIHQLLTNLCLNAADAMAGGGALTVTIDDLVVDDDAAAGCPGARPGRHLRVAVEDTGPGMPPDVLERAFEPFFTTKETGRGSGLGLAMVEAITRNHGGLVQVESDLGRGTRFVVTLPASAALAMPEEAPRPRGQGGDGELVLVVDDEEAVRSAAVHILERAGYRTITAEHGAAAVSVFAERRASIAVVILDMSMPIMDGPASAAALRAMNPEVRIIATSGHAPSDARPRFDPSNVAGFVAKPYTADVLLAAVEAALERDVSPPP